jgi:hypothetical protein
MYYCEKKRHVFYRGRNDIIVYVENITYEARTSEQRQQIQKMQGSNKNQLYFSNKLEKSRKIIQFVIA